METDTAVFIFIICMIFAGFGIYYFNYTIRIREEHQVYEERCARLTVVLNEQLEEDEMDEELEEQIEKETGDKSCIEYYCYFEPYKPPEGLEITETMCVCECRLEDGRTLRFQMLQPATERY